MSDYMHKEYKLPNGRTVTAYFNELGVGEITIEAMDYFMDMINSLVEVVRCKDCVCHSTCQHEQYLGMNGFCSYGERKEE